MNAVCSEFKNLHDTCIVPVDDLEKVRVDVLTDQKINTLNCERQTLSDIPLQKPLNPDDIDQVEEKFEGQ